MAATSTATKNRPSTRYKSFADLQASNYFSQPISKRKPLAIGRNNAKVVGRNFGLSAKDETKLRAKFLAGDKVPNPQNIGFSYYYLETLKALGPDRNHSQERVIAKFKEITNDPSTKDETGKTFWWRFKNKEARNETTGKDWLGRFEQNVRVLQRVLVPGVERKNFSPYGQKLVDVGQKILGTAGVVVDIVIGSQGQPMHRLNTNSAVPVNELKRRGRKATAESQKLADEAVAETAAPVESAPAVEQPVVESPIAAVSEPLTPAATDAPEVAPTEAVAG